MRACETTQKTQGDPSGSPLSLLCLLSERVNALGEMLLFVLILAMVGITTMQVICRFFFTALTWSEELTRFLLVFASLVGASVGFKRGNHIAITALREKFSSQNSLSGASGHSDRRALLLCGGGLVRRGAHDQ